MMASLIEFILPVFGLEAFLGVQDVVFFESPDRLAVVQKSDGRGVCVDFQFPNVSLVGIEHHLSD